MIIRFWLLDVNSEVKDGKSEVWLWGIEDSGKRVLIIHRGFLSYFYAVAKEEADPSLIVQKIGEGDFPFVAGLEIVDRKLFGRSVKAVKVYCKDPNVIPKYARILRDFEGVKDCFEDDVRYAMRYLIDNNVIPCTWHEIEVEEEANLLGIEVDTVYLAKKPPTT
ncbi:hypothetical protein KEJ15_02710, partial [Candidatus Bathyarchaeota archaeon]|nr:hypothetical protein [Candidatus Bathyarchaeota archaeon]